jgi:hypothetical protein
VRDQDRGADHPGLARGASVLIGWGVEDVVLLSR